MNHLFGQIGPLIDLPSNNNCKGNDSKFNLQPEPSFGSYRPSLFFPTFAAFKLTS